MTIRSSVVMALASVLALRYRTSSSTVTGHDSGESSFRWGMGSSRTGTVWAMIPPVSEGSLDHGPVRGGPVHSPLQGAGFRRSRAGCRGDGRLVSDQGGASGRGGGGARGEGRRGGGRYWGGGTPLRWGGGERGRGR